MPKTHSKQSPPPLQSPPPQINLRTCEAATYLNVRPATLNQWRWTGQGPNYVKIGRSVRYRITDLEKYLEARVFTSTTQAQAQKR